MKKLIKSKRTYLLLIALFIGLITIYYSLVVFESRKIVVPNITNFLESEEAKILASDLTEKQLEILLTVEDPNFYNHNGFDITTPGAGITTITQSLVKRFYFPDFKPGIAKIKQTLIAIFAVDPLISKENQLTAFINEFPFRSGVIGVSEAANFFYNKEFQDLTDDEYISIVAMFIAPQKFDIEKQKESNQGRVIRIKSVINGEYEPKNNGDVYYNID